MSVMPAAAERCPDYHPACGAGSGDGDAGEGAGSLAAGARRERRRPRERAECSARRPAGLLLEPGREAHGGRLRFLLPSSETASQRSAPVAALGASLSSACWSQLGSQGRPSACATDRPRRRGDPPPPKEVTQRRHWRLPLQKTQPPGFNSWQAGAPAHRPSAQVLNKV